MKSGPLPLLVAVSVLSALNVSAAQAQPVALCEPTDQALCLLDGRIRVEVSWINQHDGGTAGVGYALPITAQTGGFWFFNRDNLEVIAKVLDGGRLNGHIWVGIASLSDVEFTVLFTDTALGTIKTYHNPPGNRWGILDTGAFDDDLLDEGDVCGGLVAPGTPFQCRPGLFCESPDDTCVQQVDGQGICKVVPDVCPENYDPVCGCDGVTYSNDCFRQMGGASKKHDGECGTPGVSCFPELGVPCDRGQLCERPVGLCTIKGLCTPISLAPCPQIFDPVCGCNGQTFSSDCVRLSAGVSKLHDGQCEPEPQLCGGIAGFVCDAGSVCDYPSGMCNVADLAGICAERPDACPAVYDPVCGCDGVTYGNDCELLVAGAAKDRDGACE